MRTGRISTGLAALSAALLILSMLTLMSCRPAPEFGELDTYSEVDGVTGEPSGALGEFEVDVQQIVAAISISGIRGDSSWRFLWENTGTGEVIADFSDNYSTDSTAYMEGYISSRLVPSEGSAIIAEPGSYRVSYYNDGELEGEKEFIIREPAVKILGIGMYSDLDGNGDPGEASEIFYQDDDIYAALGLNYRRKGDSYGVRWYRGDLLLGEDEYTVEEDSYDPGYIIFQLAGEEQAAFPTGSYRIEIVESGIVREKSSFEVVSEEFSEDIFTSESIYTNENLGFEMAYPSQWPIEEEDIDAGIKISTVPDDDIKQVIINIWVLNKGYYPSQDGYSDFADELMADQKSREDSQDMEKSEGERAYGDLELYEVRYDNIDEAGTGWIVAFTFYERDGLLFLFMRLTDEVYAGYGENTVDYMIDSLNSIE